MKSNLFRLRGVSRVTHPLPQVVSEQQVPREVVGECGVELEHLLQSVAFNDVEVAVGQSSDVGTGLSQSHLFPENIPEYVTLTCRGREDTVRTRSFFQNTLGEGFCYNWLLSGHKWLQ